MNVRRKAAPDDAPTAGMHARADQEFDIVLKPLSHPELGDIRIDENLFPIGRTEHPFASYAPELIGDLSRRHARIFSEYGGVYIADLDSKNGTTVNGINVRQKISPLHDGDEIRFGRALSYRVQLRARPVAPARTTKLSSLTLTPERNDLGLQPIVITQFPFLISKADPAFARYKDEFPHQVTYISRRHAHIFLKGSSPFVEDLGSTNGTFVNGKRLDEHAVALEEGDTLAFGGHHFVYKVSFQKEDVQLDPTVTKLSTVAQGTVPDAANADKTTFVAAAGSFLDIFCVDPAPQREEDAAEEASKPPEDAGKESEKRRKRSRFAVFASELHEAFSGGARKGTKRALWWSVAALTVLGAAASMLYYSGAPERNMKEMLARGEYAQASAAAGDYLERHPDNAELRALSTEALLKANVPQWLALLKAGDFDRAAALLADLRQRSRRNPDLQSLLGELEWMGNLERLVATRGGVDAPVTIYRDEDKIRDILNHWNEDTQGRQRAFTAISAYVPEFKDPYAEALSHLRKLQSDDSVYLAAIDRLKSVIATELNRDHPEALDAVLKEYAEKYPRLGGMDQLRRDLRQYMEVQNEVRARRLGPLMALLAKARFSTPAFEEKFRALKASGQFPPPDVVGQYEDVSKAWRAGDAKQAFAGLQKMSAGSWADAAGKELEHKKAIADQFAALQKARGSKAYEDRLLAFYGALDPDEDVYFIRATANDIAANKDRALARAQQQLTRAQSKWRQYRDNGAIEGTQRVEGTISNQFRSQARLLAEAHEDAQQGMRIYTQLRANAPAQWSRMQEEINTETELQRKSLMDLRMVLEPSVLKAKLALLGGRNDEERQSVKTAD